MEKKVKINHTSDLRTKTKTQRSENNHTKTCACAGKPPKQLTINYTSHKLYAPPTFQITTHDNDRFTLFKC